MVRINCVLIGKQRRTWTGGKKILLIQQFLLFV